jgi:hypothetical protein
MLASDIDCNENRLRDLLTKQQSAKSGGSLLRERELHKQRVNRLDAIAAVWELLSPAQRDEAIDALKAHKNDALDAILALTERKRQSAEGGRSRGGGRDAGQKPEDAASSPNPHHGSGEGGGGDGGRDAGGGDALCSLPRPWCGWTKKMTLLFNYDDPLMPEKWAFVQKNYGQVVKFRKVVLDMDVDWKKALETIAVQTGPGIVFSWSDRANQNKAHVVNSKLTFGYMRAHGLDRYGQVEVKIVRGGGDGGGGSGGGEDALQMARHWNRQQHANVFQILRTKKITMVHCDPKVNILVSYVQPGDLNVGGGDQLNTLEDDHGWFDDNTINLFMSWWCHQNTETMLYAASIRRTRDQKKSDAFKNTQAVEMLVLSVDVAYRLIGKDSLANEDLSVDEVEHLNWRLFKEILMPLTSFLTS